MSLKESDHVRELELLYDSYLEAASTSDPSERLRLLRDVATADFELISAFPYRVSGLSDVSEKLGQVAQSMPGGELRLVRIGGPDGHHGFFRATYASVDGEGNQLSTGMHVGELVDGRLKRIIVFLPDQPAPR